jgi:hypothetical protein
MRVAGHIPVGDAPIEPDGLGSRGKNLARQFKRTPPDDVVSDIRSAVPGSQCAFWKNVHRWPVGRDIRQGVGDQNLVLERTNKSWGLSVIPKTISGLGSHLAKFPCGGGLVEGDAIKQPVQPVPLRSEVVVNTDNKEDRTLGVRQNVSAVPGGVGGFLCRSRRPPDMASVPLGRFPKPFGKTTTRCQ